MSRKFGLRRFFGNRRFLDYDPGVFWNARRDGRGADETGGFEPWFDDFVAFLKKHECKSVLEIGCGSGVNLGFVKSKIPELKCVGVDLSRHHIGLAKSLYADVEFCLGDLREFLPTVETGSFGCVLCAGILMHVLPKDIDFVVREIKRISSKVFFYEQDKRKEYGLRHSNNFVFFHDYSSLFGDWKKVFAGEYKNFHIGRVFVKEVKKE